MRKGPQPKGWYSRGYLPHLDQCGALQFITFRLADSLPAEKLQLLDEELPRIRADSARTIQRRKRIEEWLDAGYGCCALAHPQMAETMQTALQKFHGIRYQLLAWCIMPNHVHVLIDPIESLSKIVQSRKSYTGRWAMSRNAELELRVPSDRFWMWDFWDRFIRDENHYFQVLDYIEQNPVKAGLCEKPGDWPWSSARDRGAPAPQTTREDITS